MTGRISAFEKLRVLAAAWAVLLAVVVCVAPMPALADPTPTTTTLTVTPAQSYCGSSVTLRANVNPIDATGMVEFFDGATSLGTRTLDASGTAQFSIAGLSVGSHSFTAAYAGDGFFAASSSAPVKHDIVTVPTTLSIQAPAKSSCGDNVLIKVSIVPSDAPGTVQFFDGATLLGSRTLDPSGNAQISVGGFTVGVHSLTAQYGGDACHDPATSDKVSHEVNQLPSTTGLTSGSTTTCDQSVSLHANVAPVGATGNVQFFDGPSLLATRTLAPDGTVNVSVSGLAVGVHSFTANYQGDACYRPSGSPSDAHQVDPVTTSISLEAPPQSVCGSNVPLKATVVPAGGSGFVEFYDFGSSIAIRAIDGTGVVMAAIPGLAPGTHSFTATYHGDSCYLPSSSNKTSHQVDPITSTTQLQVNRPSSDCGESITFTADVSPGATGIVEFIDGATSLAQRPVPGDGHVVFSIAGLGPGNHSVVAAYHGDFCYLTSQSDKVNHFVNALPSSTQLSIDPLKTFCGDKVTLSATVSPSVSSGTVRFFDGSDPVSPDLELTSSHVDYSTVALPPGKHDITARYSGGGCYAASTSGSISQTVSRRTIATDLSSDVNPIKEGGKVTLTAAVGLGEATGTVTFYDGATVLAAVALGPDGRAILSVPDFTVGTHSLTASYGGDPCHEPSVSSKLDQVVFADQVPTVHVDYPNGGEILMVGQSAKLRWTASDDNGVTFVDLLISRNLGGSYSPIATMIPNSGTYDWTVGGPTNGGADPVYTALFRVDAHDAHGNIGTDASDGPFAIYDIATPTLIALFRAEPASGGIEVRWRLEGSAPLVGVELERTVAADGPWGVIPVERSEAQGVSIAIDRGATPGTTYHYRLAARAPNGERVTFGSTSATAQAVELALGFATPNPMTLATAIDYSVPRPMSVRLSVVDLQGREVARLIDGPVAAGKYRAIWNGRAAAGDAPAGLYFVRMRVAGWEAVRRLVLTR
jgi:hypothetical protein